MLDLARDRTETERIEGDGGRRAQERQVAEAGLELVVAHRQVLLDAFLLHEPRDRGRLVAELVDQLERDRLMPSEDTAVGDLVDLCVVELLGAGGGAAR